MEKLTYKGYAKAMIKNGCRPISYRRLENHVEYHCDTQHEHKSAWLAGNTVNGVFTPSHGGYLSLRHMVELLDLLLDSDNNILITALPNMGDMLARRGWIFAGTFEVEYPHRQDKQFYVNRVELVPDWHWEVS